jgi:enamine deaminase RidA (YjgF/YER057c/UK114 family)
VVVLILDEIGVLWYRIGNMDETQTPQTEQQTTSYTQHIDEALELANAGPKPVVQPTSEVGSVESAAQAARRTFFDRDKMVGVGVVTALATTAVLAGVALSAEHGGNSSPETRGTVDNSIESVTLNPDANIRFDPYVGEGENNNNALHLGAQITIDVNHDARILDGTKDGSWVGIPLDEVKTVIPNIDLGDKNGVVWINEQGIQEIKHTDLETK